jgi:uncharacterized SAM-binding protein YcdF (DUF218 family)
MTVLTETKPTTSAKPRRRRALLRALLLLLLIFVMWVGSVAFRVWSVARVNQDSPTDAIVVLGASQYNGTPTPVFAGRLDQVVNLYNKGVSPNVVTVGAKLPGDNYTEAEAGKSYLVDAGVPAKDITAVSVGHDTWESLRAVDNLAEKQGWESITIVSDPWHEFRSREMAEQLGLQANTSPTRTGPIVQERVTEVRSIVRETAAYVWWRFSGGAPWSGPDID